MTCINDATLSQETADDETDRELHNISNRDSTTTNSSPHTIATSINQSVNMLLSYPFLLPLLLDLLEDVDVLTRLVPTGKSLRSGLLQYRIKQLITQDQAHILTNTKRYLQFQPKSIKEVTNIASLHAFAFVERIELAIKFNQSLQPHVIPNSVKYLKLSAHFNQQIKLDDLPPHLETLLIGKWFRQRLKPEALPSILNHLYFSMSDQLRFNAPFLIPGMFHQLTELNFGNQDFNQPLPPGCLPESLLLLHFSNRWNHPVVPGVLPPRLTEVCFGRSFNHPLYVNSIPSSVRKLLLVSSFNHPIDGVLPSSLKCLGLGEKFDQPIGPNSIPHSLTHLYAAWSLAENDLKHLPSSVTHLRVDSFVPGSIPRVTHLICNTWSQFMPSAAPDSVIYLEFVWFNRSVVAGFIPPSVVHVKFGERFNQLLQPGCFPSSVMHVEFGHAFRRPLLPGMLPASVKFVTVDNQYDADIHKGCEEMTVIRKDTSYNFMEDIWRVRFSNKEAYLDERD